jgi:hypothetical protein
VIINTRRSDVGVAKPFLHLGDVGVVVERIGSGRRTQRMAADLESELRRIGAHQLVDAIRGDRCFEAAGAVVPDRPKQCTAVVIAMACGIEVVADQRIRPGMQRQIPCLATFAGNPEMRHAFPRVPEIPDLELAQFLPPQCVEQQRGQDGPVALALQRVRLRRGQQRACLVIAERPRLAFAAVRLRPLDAFNRVVGDGIFLAETVEQRRERGEPVPDRAAAKPAVRQLVAPDDDVGAGHGAEFLRPDDAGEPHEVADRVLVGTPCARVAEIGEPLDLRRHGRQPVELGGGEQPAGKGDSDLKPRS